MSQRLEPVLNSESRSLGHPRAALPGFAAAVLARNVLALLQRCVEPAHRDQAQLLIGQRGQPGVAQQRHVQRLHRVGRLDGGVHGSAASDRCDVRVHAQDRDRPAIHRLGIWPVEGCHGVGRRLHELRAQVVNEIRVYAQRPGRFVSLKRCHSERVVELPFDRAGQVGEGE